MELIRIRPTETMELIDNLAHFLVRSSFRNSTRQLKACQPPARHHSIQV